MTTTYYPQRCYACDLPAEPGLFKNRTHDVEGTIVLACKRHHDTVLGERFETFGQLKAAMGKAYQREITAARRLGRRDGLPFIRSTGVWLGVEADGEVLDLVEWLGATSLKSLREEIAAMRDRFPSADCVFVRHDFDAHETMGGERYEPNVGGFTLDVWGFTSTNKNWRKLDAPTFVITE
jgi:hypothetical protein